MRRFTVGIALLAALIIAVVGCNKPSGQSKKPAEKPTAATTTEQKVMKPVTPAETTTPEGESTANPNGGTESTTSTGAEAAKKN